MSTNGANVFMTEDGIHVHHPTLSREEVQDNVAKVTFPFSITKLPLVLWEHFLWVADHELGNRTWTKAPDFANSTSVFVRRSWWNPQGSRTIRVQVHGKLSVKIFSASHRRCLLVNNMLRFFCSKRWPCTLSWGSPKTSISPPRTVLIKWSKLSKSLCKICRRGGMWLSLVSLSFA